MTDQRQDNVRPTDNAHPEDEDHPQSLNSENQRIWDHNAAFWDQRMGEGNDFQKLLVAPATERLLELRPGDLVLDVACGNGVMARRLAQLGAQVVACDFAPTFIERARAREDPGTTRIEYRVVDATDENQLLALGTHRFDAAICNMAMMDMATIEPLLSALTYLLKPHGHFVFSVMHPCFNTTGIKMVGEEEDRDGTLVTAYSIKVSKYKGLGITRGLGMIGQPEPQYYFHRTLGDLINACLRARFVLDGIDEPSFDGSAQVKRPFSWLHYTEIPPVLVARMRVP